MLTNECVRDKVEVVFVKSVSSVAVYICDCVLRDVLGCTALALLLVFDMFDTLLSSNSV